MLIDISQSKLFSVEPDMRFARELAVDKGVWTELWKRHVLMGYSVTEVKEYLVIKTGRHVGKDCIQRWIIRTRIYSIASPILKKGAKCVNSEIFGEYEEYVIKEITKHIKSGASTNPKVII